MNENIDLTIILKGCPKGTRFYSSNCGEISFNSFRPDKEYPLLFDCCDDSYVKYTKEGLNNYDKRLYSDSDNVAMNSLLIILLSRYLNV